MKKLQRHSTVFNPTDNAAYAGVLLAALLLLISMGARAQTFVRSTARPVGDIELTFPYDIPLLAHTPGADTAARTTSEEVMLANLGERPTVMMFWLTTCGPCRTELAELAAVLPQWQRQADFAFVPVSIDFTSRYPQFHERAAEYPWTSYLDVDREFRLVMPGQLNGVPQVFVFDEDGEQVYHQRKFTPGDVEKLAAVLGVEKA